MTKTKSFVLLGGLFLLLAIPTLRVNGQSPSDPRHGELFEAIAAQDKALFDAYNQCDLAKFSSLLDENIEFYHDQGGLSVGSKDLTESIKKNICGKVTRELVPGTLEVYPMKGYALEMGVHRFHHPGHEDTEQVGEAKFIQLWQNKDGAWKLTRVFSYDHHALAK